MPLKRPVTLPQARRWPAAAKRRESFCARMGGMRALLTGERAARDPASPINRALADWDCDEPELLKREHVSKGIRMKVTASKVGSEARRAPARKNPAQKVEILEKATLPNGARIRLQKRAGKFDVVLNSTGIAWHYLSKGTSEAHARGVYEMWTLAPNPAKKRAAPAKKTVPAYAVIKVGMRTPLAVFAKRSDAVAFGQSWADIHKAPVRVIEG